MAGRHMLKAEAIIVFAKEPVPGRVKTRLAKEIGADLACQIYQELLELTLDAVAPLQIGKYMYLPPGDLFRPTKDNQQGFDLRTQKGDNLGKRMQNAFCECFANQHERIVLVGSDCPSLTPSLLWQSFGMLLQADTVFGPAADGGYYLIGQARECRDVFSGMPWSTDDVWSRTCKRLNQNNWSFELLPMLEDIDTLKDWMRYKQKVAAEDKTTQPGEKKP